MPITFSGNATVPCPNCGTYELSGSAAKALAGSKYNAGDARARIAYAVRRLAPGFVVASDFLEASTTATVLPGALEMLDNIIIHMATARSPGLPFELVDSQVRALSGASSAPSAAWALLELLQTGLSPVTG